VIPDTHKTASKHRGQINTVLTNKICKKNNIKRRENGSLTDMWSTVHVHHYTAAVPAQAGDCPSDLHLLPQPEAL